MLDVAVQCSRTAAELDGAGARIDRPNIGATTATGSACRSVTFTVPVLLNSVLIVEVVAPPLLVNVPALFTTAVGPGVAAAAGGGNNR